MDEVSTASGYLIDGFEGVSSSFTQLESLGAHGHNTLARAKRYGRWYLLKGLTDEVAGQPVYQEMLAKEFDIMMRLQDPGVVQAVAMEEVEGLGRCIVMEWVEGVTLKQWLEGTTTRDDRRRIAAQLADTLAHVHAHDVVHRDIKPSNIMVTAAKNVKLIDFGLADTDVHAVLKQPAGTASYMSPEQAMTSVPDARNDIYSLGLVLRQMDLGSLYDGPIARCLKPIDERYQSVDELKADLQRRRTRRRQATVGLWAALGVGAVAALLLLLPRAQASHDQYTSILVDSLQHELALTRGQMDSSQASQSHLAERMQQLNDSVYVLNSSNEDLLRRQAEHEAQQQRIDAAIAQGIREADAALQATQLAHHLDTLSNINYLWMDWKYLSQAGRRHTEDYIARIRNQFQAKELAEIEYAITEHCAERERAMRHRTDVVNESDLRSR